MVELNETPSGNRVRIALFGKRNAGKSTLANALTGQRLSIVSDVAGTTTDPVSKAMEILPLGPCLVTDTAGLDDDGPLGDERVKKSLAVLEQTDVAVLVYDCARGARPREACERRVWDDCAKRGVPVVEFHRGDDVEALKDALAAVRVADAPRPLVADLVRPGEVVLCVCPQDGSAPRGRLILPQQQVLRELLDAHALPVVCQVEELPRALALKPALVIADSQAFGAVDAVVPQEIPLTSFSILFARAKGDLASFCAGAAALETLKDGDRVLVSEGCTHRRQCGDIGSVKLPAWIRKHAGKELAFEFSSGGDFPDDLSRYALVVHCGGCMLTRRAVLARLARCAAAGVPVVNYGICIAACRGIRVDPARATVVRRPRHWFFDFDGTLFDTERDIKLAWMAVLKLLGLEAPDFEQRYATGPSLPDMARALFPDRPDVEKIVADVKANFGRVYDDAGFPNTHPYPEAVAWIRALKKAGKELYVATNKRRRPTLMLLEKHGLLDLFTEVYTSDSIPGRTLRKPEYLAHALATRGIDPADAVMVGDTAIDVRGGRANGMAVKTVDWGYGTAPFYARLARVLGVDRIAGATRFRELSAWNAGSEADLRAFLEKECGTAPTPGDLEACETAEDLFLRTC